MARTSDFDKLALWQQRLAAFDSSSLTVAQFCQSIACSVASFYQWRRKLSNHRPACPPADSRKSVRSVGKSASAFLPIKVRHNGRGRQSELGVELSAPVMIALPNGTRIELACDAQAALLSILQQQESVGAC